MRDCLRDSRARSDSRRKVASSIIFLVYPVECCEDVGGFGADSGVGVGFAESDGVGAVDDEDGGEGKAPTGFGGVVIAEAGVVEGDIDENGLKIAAVL